MTIHTTPNGPNGHHTRFAQGSDGRPSTTRPAPSPTSNDRSAARSPLTSTTREAARAWREACEVIDRHRDELLRYPGVTGIRVGYKVTDGWLTQVPAIVVSVVQKHAQPAIALPHQIEDVLVDVAPATPREQLTKLPLAAQRKIDTSHAAEHAELFRKSRYVAPPDLTLEPVRAAMTVTCHASPDAGWTELAKFFQATTQRMTVAMYDFTAPHVVNGLIDGMRGVRGPLKLILDPKIALATPGEGAAHNPKADDLDEDQVESKLSEALADRLQFLWAAVKLQGKITGGIFGSAYHEKVAVRDGRCFWLSSGNWQSSNQPDVDPLGADAERGAAILGTYNREWHVIVEHAGLAQLFEQYIEWDMQQARPLQDTAEVSPLPALWLPPTDELGEASPAPRFFAPRTFMYTDQRPLTVQPILSPDNYATHALTLISSARERLYFQNQYIKLAKQNAEPFEALLSAILGKIKDGLDVRLIVRDLPDTRAQLEALQSYGFDLGVVRVLKGNHNKGIIVDGREVLVGSHNWSNDGVLYNRDASVILRDPEIARYYEDIFLYDWDHRARQQLGFERAMPIVEDAPAPRPLTNHTRVPWTAIYED